MIRKVMIRKGRRFEWLLRRRKELEIWRIDGTTVRALPDVNFYLIEPEPDPVPMPKPTISSLPYGLTRVIEVGTVGAEIMQFPFAVAVSQLTVSLRHMAIGILQNPIALPPPPDTELAATDLPSLRRHVDWATDDGEYQGHGQAHSCSGRNWLPLGSHPAIDKAPNPTEF
jgi:hypothetical protein